MGRVECTDAGVTLAEQGPQVEDQLLRHRPRLKKPPSGGSNSGAASASPPSRFERLTSLKPPALPGDICFEAARAITLLPELRPALTSAAVTGKIDVRGLVPDRVEAA